MLNKQNLVEVAEIRSKVSAKQQLLYVDRELNILQETNFQALNTRAKAIAAVLQQSGFKENDRIILTYKPGLEFIAAFLACLYAKLIAVPYYPPIEVNIATKLINIIQETKPAAILADKAIEKIYKITKLCGNKAFNFFSKKNT